MTPGAVLAGDIGGAGNAVAYDAEGGDLITRQGSFSYEHLQMVPGTVYSGVDNPDLITPDSPCRDVALQWDAYVSQGRSAAYFSKLLVQLAANTCRVAYTRSSVASADGVYDVRTIHPTF